MTTGQRQLRADLDRPLVLTSALCLLLEDFFLHIA